MHTTNATAKVGIGTSNPLAKLDVKGAIQGNHHITHMKWWSMFTAPEGAFVPGYVKLTTPIGVGQDNMFSIAIKGYRYGTAGTPVEIRCGGYAYPVPSALIRTGCHTEGTSDPVGIGVEDGVVVITIGSGTSTWYYDHFSAEYTGWHPKNPDDFVWEFVHDEPPGTTNLNNVYIDDAAGTLTATSDVGIGTTSPQQRLHVKGNGVRIEEQVMGRAVEILAPVTGEHTRIHNYLTGSGFVFQNDNSDALLTIDGSGNIGIGTHAPSDKLSVQGTVRAQEVVVTLENWPDYVFDADYELKSLEEVERYIAAKGRLPGMPSEVEVRKEGVAVGAIQAKLLEKIEELTLHMVAQNKQMKAHTEQLARVMEENKQLRKELEALKSAQAEN